MENLTTADSLGTELVPITANTANVYVVQRRIVVEDLIRIRCPQTASCVVFTNNEPPRDGPFHNTSAERGPSAGCACLAAHQMFVDIIVLSAILDGAHVLRATTMGKRSLLMGWLVGGRDGAASSLDCQHHVLGAHRFSNIRLERRPYWI